MKRTYKHRRESRAVELGPVELMALLEWELSMGLYGDRPRALRNVRQRYVDFCRQLYRRLQEARRGR